MKLSRLGWRASRSRKVKEMAISIGGGELWLELLGGGALFVGQREYRAVSESCNNALRSLPRVFDAPVMIMATIRVMTKLLDVCAIGLWCGFQLLGE